MIRNEYLNKFREKDKFDAEIRYAQDDDNYLLKSYRPLSEKALEKVNQNKLETFVDDLLDNKKLSQLLFSSNAKSEIRLMQKSNEFMLRNGIKKKVVKIKNTPNDIVVNRKKKEMIAYISGETDVFKENRNDYWKMLTDRNNEFNSYIKSERKLEQKGLIESYNKNRVDRFKLIYNNIKEKLKNFYENDCKFRDKPIFDNEYIQVKEVDLPHIELNMEDVFSRLYHNAVFIQPKTRKAGSTLNSNSLLNKKVLNSLTSSESNKDIINDNINKKVILKGNAGNQKLNVKNVIESANGKEFTIKVTDEILMKCFTKHSGGPGMISNGKVSLILSLYYLYFKTNRGFNHSTKHGNDNFINLLESKDDDGNTFLHSSIKDNFYELIGYLLVKGVEVNVQNNEGDTPLHIAMRNAKTDVIQMMLECNADIDKANKKGETPFDLATVKYIILILNKIIS